MSLRVTSPSPIIFSARMNSLRYCILAPADIGLRRQHAQPVIGQRVAAVIGFAAPDREHDGGGHAEARFDPGKRRAIFRHQPLPLLRQPRDAGFLQIIGRHLHELGLRRRAGRRTPGQDQIGQFVIRLEAARLGIEGRARDACGLRFRPERGDECREAGIGAARAGRGWSNSRRPSTATNKQREQAHSRVGQIEAALDTLDADVHTIKPVRHIGILVLKIADTLLDLADIIAHVIDRAANVAQMFKNDVVSISS